MKLDGSALGLTDREKALRAALPRASRPKLAATLVLIHTIGDTPRILMGQRSTRHDFMPSVYVFPGGRVDRADSYAPYLGALPAQTETILEACLTPRRARALVLAAIRETYEETGLMLGQYGHISKTLKHPSWDMFRAAQMIADISDIHVFGRAITPPHRHKRFDTWFFVKTLTGERPQISDSPELNNVNWFTFDQIAELNTHRATKMMLSVLKHYLSHDTPPSTIFFSHMRRGAFVQEGFPMQD